MWSLEKSKHLRLYAVEIETRKTQKIRGARGEEAGGRGILFPSECQSSPAGLFNFSITWVRPHITSKSIRNNCISTTTAPLIWKHVFTESRDHSHIPQPYPTRFTTTCLVYNDKGGYKKQAFSRLHTLKAHTTTYRAIAITFAYKSITVAEIHIYGRSASKTDFKNANKLRQILSKQNIFTDINQQLSISASQISENTKFRCDSSQQNNNMVMHHSH